MSLWNWNKINCRYYSERNLFYIIYGWLDFSAYWWKLFIDVECVVYITRLWNYINHMCQHCNIFTHYPNLQVWLDVASFSTLSACVTACVGDLTQQQCRGHCSDLYLVRFEWWDISFWKYLHEPYSIMVCLIGFQLR